MILWQSGCEAEGKERRAAERQADEEAKNVFTFKNVSEGSFKKEKDMIEEVRALDNKNVEKTDPARHLIFLEANKEVKVQDKYKIAVKENKLAPEMSWLIGMNI